MQEKQVRSLGREDPLEKEKAIHSSILAWEIPWTDEPGRATVHEITKSVRYNLATKQHQCQNYHKWLKERVSSFGRHIFSFILGKYLESRKVKWYASVCESVSRSVMSDSLWPHGLKPTRLRCPWNSPSKNTGVHSHSLLQENLPDPGVEPSSPVLYADSLSSEPPGKP